MEVQDKINEALASLARIEEKVNIIGDFLAESIRMAQKDREERK